MKYRILKESEYEENKYALPNPGRRFWIESERELGVKHCGYVTDEGLVDKNGAFCTDTTMWLRPVLEYEKDEKRLLSFTKGQQVTLHGLEWTAISDDILVCDRCVEEVKFDDNETDFEGSYLKYVLYQYMKRRSSEEVFKSMQLTGKEDADEIEVDESEFSYSFLANVICIFMAAVSGVICALSFSPISVSLFAIVVIAASIILGKYNVKKIKDGIENTKRKYRKQAVSVSEKGEKEPETPKSDYSLELEGIEEGEVRAKSEEINKLLEGLMKTGNRQAIAKVKFFYIPETQKTLELYRKLYENDIDTPNSNECMEIISENLDKTIRLLKIEYDKAASDDLLDARLSSGVIGKMLDDAESQEQNKLVLK